MIMRHICSMFTEASGLAIIHLLNIFVIHSIQLQQDYLLNDNNKNKYQQNSALYKNQMYARIKCAVAEAGKCPHCLIELSASEFKQFQSNSIILTDLKLIEDEESHNIRPVFVNMTFGINIKKVQSNFQDDRNNNKTWRLDIDRMKSQYCFMLAKVEECIKIFPNMFMHASNMKTNREGRKNRRINGSGYTVLFLGMFHDKVNYENTLWEPLHVAALKRCKPNINSSVNAHFGSVGYYASFGNKGNYAVIDNSSVSQYSNQNQ